MKKKILSKKILTPQLKPLSVYRFDGVRLKYTFLDNVFVSAGSIEEAERNLVENLIASGFILGKRENFGYREAVLVGTKV